MRSFRRHECPRMAHTPQKQTRRVCGAVSPDLSLQVHNRVFDLAVEPACVLFHEPFQHHTYKGEHEAQPKTKTEVKWRPTLVRSPLIRTFCILLLISCFSSTEVSSPLDLCCFPLHLCRPSPVLTLLFRSLTLWYSSSRPYSRSCPF